ncbi:hypothetical protein XB05_19295 [Xanthomonas arboricola]|nr:hypothetical protein XB05_19295 [Xanthomonas arboricola]
MISPGSLVWTQAGTGIVHEKFPAFNAHEVHGVQIFVNQSKKAKQLPPDMFHLDRAMVPVVMDTQGNRTRVLSGRFSGATSPIKPVEAFDLLDVQVVGDWNFEVPRRRNTLIYALSGRVAVSVGAHARTLSAFEAVTVRVTRPSTLHIKAETAAQLLVLSGTDPGEPIARHGPFIMNDADALEAAFERYRDGAMGRITPLGDAMR